ncbi:MAG: hypothetical protein ACTSRU_12685 [Candidatus Hodarchaeales archaeon]
MSNPSKQNHIEYSIEGGWYGGVCYEIFDVKTGHTIYGGQMTKLRDCRRWILRKYPKNKYEVKFSRSSNGLNVGVKVRSDVLE